jgi:serine-type D-Ala-D-Ala carboxypeptidase (penicillin-binding protein 5/6)
VQTRRLMLHTGSVYLLMAQLGAMASANGPMPPDQPSDSQADTPLGPMDVVARWAYIMDHNTGAGLLDKNGEQPMPPSSMAKLMTLYIVYQRLRERRLMLDQLLPVSERAWRMGGSKMFVEVGSTVTVEDLIRGVVVQSGNDASLVLAEAIGESETGFVDIMNEEAKRLGLTATVFRNCTGWPDPDQHMSCRDIAVIAHHIILEFPEYYHFDSEKSFEYNGVKQYNRNLLVRRDLADGLKTGHTEAGGYGLCASALRNGRRIIMVLNGMPTRRVRLADAKRLLEWSFREFVDVVLFGTDDKIDWATVWLGAQPRVPLVPARDVVVTVPNRWRDKTQVSIAYKAPVAAPVSAGDTVGRLTVAPAGMKPVIVPLVAGADIERLGLPRRGIAVMESYLESLLKHEF